MRQIAHRAREHVGARRPRTRVSSDEQQRVVARFLAAVRGGDLQGLLDVLAPDVVLVADGGGIAAAARRPLHGAERVAAFLARAAAQVDVGVEPVWLNGAPGARIELDGVVDTAVSVTVEHGRITRLWAVRNPQKLSGLTGVASLART